MNNINLISATPHARIVTATPALVDALLAMNTSNRKHRLTASTRLAGDIRNGAWLLTASGIGVDRDGVLSDGQHRLYAIKAAGYPPVQFLLMTGLDPLAQSVVDRHAKRSLADSLSMVLGRTVSTQVVATARILSTISNATSKTGAFAYENGSGLSDSSTAATLMDWQDDIEAVIGMASSTPRAACIAALSVYFRNSPDDALTLCQQLKTKIYPSQDSASYRLQDTLDRLRSNAGSGGSMEVFKFTVSAVIAHSERRVCKQLKRSESWAQAPWKQWKGSEL